MSAPITGSRDWIIQPSTIAAANFMIAAYLMLMAVSLLMLRMTLFYSGWGVIGVLVALPFAGLLLFCLLALWRTLRFAFIHPQRVLARIDAGGLHLALKPQTWWQGLLPQDHLNWFMPWSEITGIQAVLLRREGSHGSIYNSQLHIGTRQQGLLVFASDHFGDHDISTDIAATVQAVINGQLLQAFTPTGRLHILPFGWGVLLANLLVSALLVIAWMRLVPGAPHQDGVLVSAEYLIYLWMLCLVACFFPNRQAELRNPPASPPPPG